MLVPNKLFKIDNKTENSYNKADIMRNKKNFGEKRFISLEYNE